MNLGCSEIDELNFDLFSCYTLTQQFLAPIDYFYNY